MEAVNRKPGQGILIGDNIQVFVLRIEGGDVRLGIQAPREVHIGRSDKPGKRTDRRKPPKEG